MLVAAEALVELATAVQTVQVVLVVVQQQSLMQALALQVPSILAVAVQVIPMVVIILLPVILVVTAVQAS
jgi:hypothetical protein